MSAVAFAAPPTAQVARTDTPFARDVIAGLSRRRKSVPCTWLYDHRGCELFDQITQLDEYYPARAEAGILERFAPVVGALAGVRATVVEFGSGSSRKTPLLLAALDRPGLYVPIDISAQYLVESVSALKAAVPRVPMQPVIGDFTQLHELPLPPATHGRRLGFFAGSTIGNFAPEEARALLERMGRLLGRGSLLLVGADGTLDPAVLQSAYDDPLGVTAAFNRNLLARINRELAGRFELESFEHAARWDYDDRCIEMHLVSKVSQRVQVLDRSFLFAAGETIHTESSFKYGPLRFQAIAGHAGWTTRRVFTDSHSQYAVYLLERPL
jgi:dimethylhistidine N-methyltransferase